MGNLLLTHEGLINRGKFWLALVYYLLTMAIVGVVCFVLSLVIPGDPGSDGFSVSGARAIPFVIVVFAYLIFLCWSGICVGIKRFHDRNKSGWWILIQFVPVIGPFWYFVEAFCLKGTTGPNRFGPDPLQG